MQPISSSYFIPREHSNFADVFKRVRILPLYSFPHIKDMDPRIVEHKKRFFIHMDFDAFYAQVEQRDNPKLRGKPVSVGGTEDGKGIVMTASYEARACGVDTGMSVWEAKKICPEIISVPCHGEKYEGIMNNIMHLLRDFVPPECIEQYSIDECFIEVSPIAATFEQANRAGEMIKNAIKKNERLTTSLGISYNKSFAKLATKLQKPDGLTLISKENKNGIQNLSVGKLWGVGRRIQLRMNIMGIKTIGDLASYSVEGIRKEFGINGVILRRLARGEDTSGIHKKEEKNKCLNHHHTLMRSIYKAEDVHREIRRIGEYICRKLRSKQLVARHIGFSIRFSDLTYTGNEIKLSSYTNDDREIFKALNIIYEKLHKPTKQLPARMFGITVFDLHLDTGETNLNLFEEKLSLPYYALDKIKCKYGESIIRVGLES